MFHTRSDSQSDSQSISEPEPHPPTRHRHRGPTSADGAENAAAGVVPAACASCIGPARWTRRSALAAAGLTVAAAAAACGGSDDRSPSSPSPATTGATDGGVAAGQQLAAVGDIPDGGCLVSGEVLLARTGDTVVGHSSVCTHKGGRVAPDGADARCPLHGSVFNATTGAVVKGPATEALPAVPVQVRSGAVFTA